MHTHAISSTELARGAIDGVILLYKIPGETPLEALYRLKSSYPSLSQVPLSYAGRLDPLAEGLMLVLSGSYNQQREKFLKLDKTYQIEVLFGFSTDTGDILGKVTNFTLNPPEVSDNVLTLVAKDTVGVHEFSYPVYSSKPVNGKPLHVWAKEDKLGEIVIPKTKATIYNAVYSTYTKKSSSSLYSEIESCISKVKGDFRQLEILHTWKQILIDDNKDSLWQVASFEVSCASGAYMRTLADYIGNKVGTPALAFAIKRVAAGPFDLSDCIDI